MEKMTFLTIILISLLLLMSGCASEKSASRTEVKKSSSQEDTPESVLLREIADGKIVEVYDEFVRVSAGKTKDNWMIISNVKDTAQEFKIAPCSMCVFDSTSVKIPAGGYKIIKFQVDAEPGKEQIRVKDSLNNAYGYVDISVIVE